MTAAANSPSIDIVTIPDLPSTRFYAGALALLSVLQYFVAEAAVIGAWTGPQPYSRRTGYISDLGALDCGIFNGRDVCSPAHGLMNASFVVQGVGMMVGALLLTGALLCTAARPGAPMGPRTGLWSPWAAATAVRVLMLAGGAGTVIVGLVPEDAGSAWHVAGAVAYFAAGGLALLVLGWLWRGQTPLAWIIFACGLASLGALIAGGVTGMEVPEPGTLERLMGYPITVGMATAGLVVAQRMGEQRSAAKPTRSALAR